MLVRTLKRLKYKIYLGYVWPDLIPADLRPKTDKPRVLCFTETYPEFSETYMHEEFAALSEDYEVQVLALQMSRFPRAHSLPYIQLVYRDEHLSYGNFDRVNLGFTNRRQQKFLAKLDTVLDQFKPHILHAHYLYLAWLLGHVSDRRGIPWTMRTHSFDMLEKNKAKRHAGIDALKSPHCKGVFVFPEFEHEVLSRGVPRERVHTAWPVVNVGRFYNEAPREPTRKVMCGGPCIAKKAHTTFIDLAKKMAGAGYQFSLYTKGHIVEEVAKYNRSQGSPVSIQFAEPEMMSKVYRDYDWIVYTSDPAINRVGLPASVVEAQASGIGVCLQELPGRRQAQLDFVGGGGFVFESIDDVPGIITQPYPEEMRRSGLESSKRCDVRRHKQMLDQIWAPLLARPLAPAMTS